jgi:hypothetical protein
VHCCVWGRGGSPHADVGCAGTERLQGQLTPLGAPCCSSMGTHNGSRMHARRDLIICRTCSPMKMLAAAKGLPAALLLGTVPVQLPRALQQSLQANVLMPLSTGLQRLTKAMNRCGSGLRAVQTLEVPL